MDTVLFAFNAVLPAFVIIALGMVAGWVFPSLDPLPISRLAMYFTTPALIVTTTSKAKIPLQDAGILLLAYLLYLLILAGITQVLERNKSKSERKAVTATSLFGNTGNMGLSLALFAYGTSGLEHSVVIFVVSMLLMFSLSPALLSSQGGSVGKRLLDAWKLPPVWAAVLGIVLNATQAPLPVALDRVLVLLGQAAIPTMLLLLGIQVYRSWTWNITHINWNAIGLKILISPLIAYIVGSLLQLNPISLAVLVLTGALPTAVNVFGVAVEVQGDYTTVGRTIFLSTVLSVVSITLCLLLFSRV